MDGESILTSKINVINRLHRTRVMKLSPINLILVRLTVRDMRFSPHIAPNLVNLKVLTRLTVTTDFEPKIKLLQMLKFR